MALARRGRVVAPDKPRVGYGTDRPRKQSKKRYVEPPTKPEATTGGRECSPEQRRVFWDRRDAGFSVRAASKYANFSYSTGLRLNEREQFLHVPTEVADQDILKAPRRVDRLPDEAKRAREDFAYFQRRYFGRIAVPWQVEAAQEVIKWLETDDEEYMVVNAPPGAGKPIAVDEPVSMADGSRKRMGDIRAGDWVISAEGRACRVEAVHEQGSIPVVRITTAHGRRVVAAPDHPFLTEDGFKEADQLTGGDFLPLVSYEPVVGSYPTVEEMRLAGYFVGDGCTVNGNATVTNDDPEILADFELCLKSKGWRVNSIRTDPRGKATTAQASSDGQHRYGPRAWLTEWGMRDHTSHTKRVPAQVYRAPNDVVAHFIGAYFACDGHVSPDGATAEFYSVNRDLLVDVQSLLTRFGIASAVRGKLGRYKGQPHHSYRLVVRQREVFAAVIPVAGRKGHILERLVQRRPFFFHDIVETVENFGYEDCRCLTVEGDHTFLVADLPVHNSTLFTLDLSAWITCRNRSIRGLIGSRTATQAKWYTGRLRRALERTQPERAELMQARLGLAVDAETTMARDFGRFKPMDRDLWTSDSFIVMQESGVAISEKEPTWSSFGMDSGFLGGRYDIVIWDDVVDPSKTRTVEQVDYQRSWWDDVSETRLEPGGLLILQGQRIGAEDLYRYNLDKTVPDFVDDDSVTFDDDDIDDGSGHKKYHHVMFKAHYEDRCKGAETHKPSAAPYPEGCLLYPRRLGWKKLATQMQNNRERFRVLYQQEDSDPQDVLVPPAWVWGHGDFPGCVDKDRDRLELPDGAGHMLSVVSCDPSPTNNWAIEWWLFNPVNEERYLIDLYRGRLDAPGFLDYNMAKQGFTGIMEEWQARSVQLGARISHWIVEINAAQRFLLQYDHFRRWKTQWGVEAIAHTTGRNKSDPDYGVTTLAPHWQFGRVRLPGKGEGLIRSMRLIDEVTRYQTNGGVNRSDDCVMAQFFFEWQLPNIKNPSRLAVPQKRPSWLVKAS